jgi:hypothetical protein
MTETFSSGSRRVLFLAVVLLLMTGMLLFFEAGVKIYSGWQQRNWPVTDGTVTAAHVAGIRALRPEISYQYEIRGQIYSTRTDLNTPGFGNRRYRRGTAERILNEYPPGSHIRVHYNPIHPDISLICPGPFWSDFMQFGLALILVTAGIILWPGVLKSFKRT